MKVKDKLSREPLPDEAEHIHQARDGDKEAYRYLVVGYQDRLLRMVLSMVPKREQAEDLVQEIFVKAYFALPAFEGNSAFYTWLFRIASNHCLDFLRKRRLPEVPLEGATDDNEEMSLVNQLPGPAGEEPDAALDTDNETGQVLEALTADQRHILSLRELEGYSYEEIAKSLNCGINTIKSRLNRAREALRVAFVRKYGNILESNTVKDNEETQS